jgi:hypothetical protein
LSFFLSQESLNTNNSLERAAQIYQQLTCATSVKQAVENLSNNSHVNHAMLAEESVQIALDNLLCMDFII